MMDLPTLPPVLYWSPSLAEHLNLDYEHDIRHGLIDATVASVLLATAGGGWHVLADLPDDAVRLVAEHRVSDGAHSATEWGVRWINDEDEYGEAPHELCRNEAHARNVHDLYPDASLVTRTVHTGPWEPVVAA